MIVAIMFVGVIALQPATASATDCVITSTLKVGSTGTQVVCLQQKLDVTTDGYFGAITKAAVMAFQAENSLVADGIVRK